MNRIKFYAISLLAAMIIDAGHGLAQAPASNPHTQAASTAVTGSGTAGQLKERREQVQRKHLDR